MKRFFVVTACLMFISAASLTFARHSILPYAATRLTVKTAVNKTPAPATTQPKIAPIETELITVTPHGFEPREITRPKGTFLLLVENRSGLNSVEPQLILTGGVKLLDIAIPREEPDWSEVVNVQPGIYLLTESNHPTWLFRLTITQ
jgi:hypothetical protein